MGYFKIFLITLIVSTFTSISANASLLLEPHVGYILNSDTTYQSINFKHTGPQYGARIGARVAGLMGGLDFTHSTFTEKISGSGVEVKTKQKRDDIGVFVGYNAPILLRAWVAYYFSSKQSQVENDSWGSIGDYSKGHATEIGVGFTPLPLISINLTYKMIAFNKDQDGTAINPNLKANEIALGVSLPLTIL
jgi:hypothetical protein